MRDISLHILDLFQNSLEAGASCIWISVTEDSVQDKLVIAVKDNGRGMSCEECAHVTDPFITSRDTRRVGLGIPLLKMYSALCGGGVRIKSEKGKGTTVESEFQYSHIDRPPLGPIADTIKILIISNPEIDFKYSHRIGNKVFNVSTQEIVQQLGEIPLSSPEVIQWLDDYLSENIAFLRRC